MIGFWFTHVMCNIRYNTDNDTNNDNTKDDRKQQG